jgi:hypothetical protein
MQIDHSHPGLLGVTIIDHLWDELDAVVEGLMVIPWRPNRAHEKGKALGLAIALAYMYSPAEPNVDQIREESANRYDRKHNPEAYLEDETEEA